MLARLEAYLDGELPAAERAALEAELATSATLRAMLADYERARLISRAAGVARLKARLREAVPVEKQEMAPRPPVGRTPALPRTARRPRLERWPVLRPWLAFAAVLLVAALGWWRWSLRAADPQRLFAAYYDAPYPNVAEPVTRGATAAATTRTQAFAAYEAADYAVARRGFEALLAGADSADAVLHLYAGTAALAQDSVASALGHLRRVPATSGWRAPAAWYQALAALRANQPAAARPPLTELAAGSSAYAARARRLLGAL